jgi:formate dehydrogenase major subunit
VQDLPAKPGKTYMDIINTCKVVYAVGVNPMISAPDLGTVKKALQNMDFLVVQDIFMTETAELADVVFPAAAWVEREGTHTGVDRRVIKVNKIVDPPGEAKPDWWIIAELANRMGRARDFDHASAEKIFEEIRRCVPQYAGISYQRLEEAASGIHWPCPSEEHPGTSTMFTEKFNTPDGKGHFVPAEFKPPAEPTDDEYPFVLTTGRVIFHYHTGSITGREDSLTGELSEAFLQMNPIDADRLRIHDGERVIASSRRRKIGVKARPIEDVCSVDIPLSKPAHNFNKVAGSMFGYHPGEDRNAPLPYSDIPEDERRSQSTDLQHPEAVGRTNSSATMIVLFP